MPVPVAIGLAVAAIGSSVYNTQKQATASKKAADNVSAMNAKAIADAKAAESNAAEQAANAINEKRRSRARSQSIFTSPLGLTTQAATTRKMLLGE